MTVKQFTTKIKRLTITVVKETNGSYSAYENHRREEGGNELILHSWCIHWLIETLYMRYIDEGLITEF